MVLAVTDFPQPDFSHNGHRLAGIDGKGNPPYRLYLSGIAVVGNPQILYFQKFLHFYLLFMKPGIQRILECISQDIKTKYRQQNEHSGDQGQQGIVKDVLLAFWSMLPQDALGRATPYPR